MYKKFIGQQKRPLVARRVRQLWAQIKPKKSLFKDPLADPFHDWDVEDLGNSPCQDYPYIRKKRFWGTLEEVFIKTDNVTMSMPEEDKEVYHFIHIHRDGTLQFRAYAYVQLYLDGNPLRSIDKKLSQDKVDRIFEALSESFSLWEPEFFADDSGSWSIDLVNTEKERFHIYASLPNEPFYEGQTISQIIRKELDIPDLLLMDRNEPPNSIQQLRFAYDRHVEMPRPRDPFASYVDEEAEKALEHWHFHEEIIIDRTEQTLTYVQAIDDERLIKHEYYVKGAISELLDELEECEFDESDGDPNEPIPHPEDVTTYRLQVTYDRGDDLIVENSFDKRNLTYEFDYIARTIKDFMATYELGQMLDPKVYNQVKPCKDDYIYCSVTFQPGGKWYYYRTEDHNISLDDFVIVPAGPSNDEKIVKVEAIEYYQKDEVPLPLDKTKSIIRLARDADFNDEEEPCRGPIGPIS